MESGMRSLITDHSRYVESFRVFLENSTEHQCMQQFIQTKLPDVISSIGNGKPAIRVLSVGGGSGEIDLQILSKIHFRYPEASINNDVIEPSPEQVSSYKELVAKTPGLDHIRFCWHKQTSSEFELQVNEKKQDTKYDFIHMIQMLYFEKDIPTTLKFFRSCLAPDGKLLIILVSGNSSWKLLEKYGSSLPLNDQCQYVAAGHVADMLSSVGARYQCYDLESELDITECFVEGNRNGELLLDFITETCEFKKYAPPELREEIIHHIRSPGCSTIKDGKIIFNCSLGVIVVDNE
ncbi:histamine N-methyltransferase B-like [Mixophyes fleayi]|uniref:histamine N-methyltransferase B-like n=1 Tax=Mixophyes fleayi TaxID=3061075 RepID=UPI003F4E0D6D